VARVGRSEKANPILALVEAKAGGEEQARRRKSSEKRADE